MSFKVYGSMNVLAYACICGPVNKRYRSSETHFHSGYRHKCIWLLAANKGVFVCFFVSLFVLFFNINLRWCNLLIQLVSMIIVRSA